MKEPEKMKMIDNIESKLKILYKNMNKDEYYQFLDDNKEVKVYNDLINNIILNNLPSSYLLFLPTNILYEINSKVFDKLCIFMNNEKELVII